MADRSANIGRHGSADGAGWFADLQGRNTDQYGGRIYVQSRIWQQFCDFRFGRHIPERAFSMQDLIEKERDREGWPDFVGNTFFALDYTATRQGGSKEDRFDVNPLHISVNWHPMKACSLTWFDAIKSLGFDEEHGVVAERFEGDYAGPFKTTFFHFEGRGIFCNGSFLTSREEPTSSSDVLVRIRENSAFRDRVIDLAMNTTKWICIDHVGKMSLLPCNHH